MTTRDATATPPLRLILDAGPEGDAAPASAPAFKAGAGRDTPAMRQYARFKAMHPGCVLFFRMGDFYEMFDEDALTAHRALGITLTQRTPGVPMAGVPYHSAEGYLRRMLEQGYRVAVCEQIEDAEDAKGVVERAVTRVLTPGALVDEALLRDDRPNSVAAVVFLDAGDGPGGRVAAAAAELSTGAFAVFECEAGALSGELERRAVREVAFAEASDGRTPARVARALEAARATGTGRPSWHFRREEALECLRAHFRVATLAGFGLSDDEPCVLAAGALLRYLRETQAPGAEAGAAALAHLSPPRREDPSAHLALDGVSLRALEVERTMRPGVGAASVGGARDEASGSLLGLFLSGPSACVTPMGKRLLREWLVRPLRSLEAIEARHACVATLCEAQRTRREVCEALGAVQDAARIAGRAALGRATPRDLAALGRSLSASGALIEALGNAPAFAGLRAELVETGASLGPLAADIAARCVDSPPPHLREGGLIRDGVDAALDEARLLQRDATGWLAAYQSRLAAEFDLPSLKVGFNRVFGYYIELPAAQARRAPEALRRTQTLKNAERYTTPELREFEHKVTTARERALAREEELFRALCAQAAAAARTILRYAAAVAEIDALRSFAEHAARNRWRRPAMTEGAALVIREGRHPVLEQTLGSDFVPNDVELGAEESGGAARLALITGPNMAGKSTFIRQVALIALLAHAGSFVPAESATIGLVDRIFTRVGADDALHAGQSTFMVEMTETANILHHATPRSLVVLDEIGRGTSTLDGLALAWAIAERLAGGADGGRGPRTLFATHYHELTQLEAMLPGRVSNLHVAVREWAGAPTGRPGEEPGSAGEIVFLHRIVPGASDRSYGVHVARLAGLPAPVVARARDLLESLTVSHERADLAAALPPEGGERRRSRSGGAADEPQLRLFAPKAEPHPVVEELRGLDLERMTPMQAFDALRKLAEQARDGST